MTKVSFTKEQEVAIGFAVNHMLQCYINHICKTLNLSDDKRLELTDELLKLECKEKLPIDYDIIESAVSRYRK